MSNILVKSNDKFYFKIDKPWSINSYGANCLINGKEPKKADFNQNWYESDEFPTTVTRITTSREYTDWNIKEEYKHLNLPPVVDKFERDEDGDNPSESMFYTQNFVEKKNEETQDLEWETEITEDVKEPVLFVGVNESSWGKDNLIKISPASSFVDSLNNPDIVLPSKACALTGDQLYKIVRHHIKANIDTRYAKVTSDYDFCFDVKKLLAIPPVTKTYDAKTNRQRKPRMMTYKITNREVSVFEMTPPSKKYNSYTPIQGIKAESHAELKKQLDTMLLELMKVINEPLSSCENCDGTGVISPRKVETNG